MEKEKNIPTCLIVGKYYFPFEGGIEDNIRNISTKLSETNNVNVLSFSHNASNGVEIIDGVRVIRCKTQIVWKSQPVSISYAAKVLTEPADVIHFHAPNVWGSLFLFIRFKILKSKSRLVITHHMDIYGRPILRYFARFLYDTLVSHSKSVIVTSLKNAKISEDLRVDCSIESIPLGLDVKRFALSKEIEIEASELRHSLGGGPLIAFVGRHARYKGLDILLHAVAQLPDVRLILAGDGPCTVLLQKTAAELGVADRVIFTGRVTHEKKMAILKAADVFAFPSTEITEAFGISQLEAMIVGTPVVASNLPTGVTDVSINNVSALLVEPNDSHSLASGLNKILEDKKLSTRIATCARNRVLSIFNNDIVSKKAAEVIERAIIK
ncbi:glycosyltransferase [Novosphingobium sp. KA1]|uniref:glycosyltransferase n=1 Tax=Novosphingobium sp. (strain KA1) TaxID=164608 RepID=UPI001AF20BC4|nr:glycosyltransferase [Novosphingobium sp. KA1]QSR16202.1 hypothetical protein CA833_03160 [Novosphingobium sp. KA1]